MLGCGGTRLAISGGSISSEQAWNELSAGEGATGGGVSEVFALPTFQQSASVPKAPNGFVGRGVPDVAGDADPESGYNVLVDGDQTVIGGTSAVAPLWAGLLARINQSLGTSVGYLNPLALCRERGKHVARYHQRQQRQLLRRAGMGSLHWTWLAKWSSVAGRAGSAKHKAGAHGCFARGNTKSAKPKPAKRKAAPPKRKKKS